MDTMSKTPDGKKWRSVMKKGVIRRDTTGHYYVSWKDEFDVFSALNEGGRGMELSDLTYYNGNLFTFDDRTGVVFKVVDKELLPYRILLDGNGKNTKGMKCEWATVKDGVMYVGSTGKEWTTPKGEFVNNNPLWVKTIDRQGNVGSEDWLDVFTKLRKATGTLYPGYLLHEAVRWNASQRRWYFIPRRASELPYDEESDEERGTNFILSTDEDFGDVTVMRLGEVNPSHGFSAFQFVPYRENEVIALRTQEYKGTIASYIMAFDLDGNMLMEEELVGDVKFEGLEFI
jgi:soluble calcium-activated nucleotidase 1